MAKVLVETIYGPGLVDPSEVVAVITYESTAKGNQFKLYLRGGGEFYMRDTEKNARAVFGDEAELLRPTPKAAPQPWASASWADAAAATQPPADGIAVLPGDTLEVRVKPDTKRAPGKGRKVKP